MSDSNIQILNAKEHASLKMSEVKDFKWSEKMNYITISMNEVFEVGKEFPIVFTDDENPKIMMITGFGQTNLALDSEGKWRKKYVPVFLRRYPFFLSKVSQSDDGNINYALAADMNAACFAGEEGRTFFEEGKTTEFTQNTLKMIGNYEQELLNTQKMMKEFKNLGILESQEFKVEQDGKTHVLAKGFLVMNREKLNALSDEILARWTRTGIIGIIDMHLHSFGNVRHLLSDMVAKKA